MIEAQDKINLFYRFSMTSADVQLIDRIHFQQHVPRAGTLKSIPSSPITFIVHTKYLNNKTFLTISISLRRTTVVDRQSSIK